MSIEVLYEAEGTAWGGARGSCGLIRWTCRCAAFDPD